MKMDFGLSVNDVLPDEITRIDSSLVPPRFYGDQSTLRLMQIALANLINKLGEQSATTQGLNKIITSDEKLRDNPTQFLYLMKDAELNRGTGGVVGLLKVGPKTLYLHDRHGAMHKIDSFCILDFYVVGEKQRMGYGKKLFDTVLMENKVTPREIAIDSPSEKMMQFLSTHYDIHDVIRQSNHFVVAAEFFNNTSNNKPLTPGQMKQNTPTISPRSSTYVRNVGSIGSIIHGDEYMAYKSKYTPSPKPYLRRHHHK